MVIAIISQARVGSSRLPRKILKGLGDKTMLDYHLLGLNKSVKKNFVVIATTFEDGVHEIIDIAESNGARVFQGSTSDVLSRYYHAAVMYEADIVVRVTSDCPLIDGELIDKAIVKLEQGNYDIVSTDDTFPDGLDFSVFRASSLRRAYLEATLRSDREHVSAYIKRNANSKSTIGFPLKDMGQYRLTLDYIQDYEMFTELYNIHGGDLDWVKACDALKDRKEIFTNQTYQRNEGYLKSLEDDKE